MRKFVLKVIIVLLPSITLMISIEYAFRDTPNNYKLKFSEFTKNQKDNISCLYFGSSHSLFGINPKFSKTSSFNLANTSQTIDYDLKIYEKKCQDLNSLSTVFIELSYFSLGYRLENGSESWRKNIYDHYLDNNQLIFLSIYPNLVTNVKSIINYHFSAIEPQKTNIFGYQSNGIKERTIDFFINDSKKATNRHLNENNEVNKKFYTEFIRKLLLKKIRVVVHTPPLTSFYKNFFDIKQRVLVESFLNELKQEYKEIIVIDNSELFNERLDLFHDSDHLNSKGAEIYTKHLNEYLK